MQQEKPNVCFVLSAGRTGTVLLAELLHRHFPEVVTVHEPSPARYELIIGNLRNETGLGGQVLRWLFRTARKKRLPRVGHARGYVEINPLLCPALDLLEEVPVPFNIVHMVREPLSWANSITEFRASRLVRPWVDLLPFTKPYPWPRPAGWTEMPDLERALWRWRFCNESILRIKSRCCGYALIRYEDLFAPDIRKSLQTFRRIIDLLPVRADADLSGLDLSIKVNSSRQSRELQELPIGKERAICGELMTAFGYG
jgi:hypothetical protein